MLNPGPCAAERLDTGACEVRAPGCAEAKKAQTGHALPRRLLGRLVPALVLLLGACTPPPAPPPEEEALRAEAVYRLLFNDALVGNAFFALQIGADGAYRLEAFTLPAGKMEQAAGHEVLEVSRGTIADGQVRPQAFDHSVMDGERIETINLVFDWEKPALQLSGKDGSGRLGLAPGTHDRLSYLLTARRLATAGAGATQIQIASPDGTEPCRLEVVGGEPVAVPFGRFEAVAIARVTPDSGDSRQLWFDAGTIPLPLRVVHSWDENTVEMQLETFSRLPNDPR